MARVCQRTGAGLAQAVFAGVADDPQWTGGILWAPCQGALPALRDEGFAWGKLRSGNTSFEGRESFRGIAADAL